MLRLCALLFRVNIFFVQFFFLTYYFKIQCMKHSVARSVTRFETYRLLFGFQLIDWLACTLLPSSSKCQERHKIHAIRIVMAKRSHDGEQTGTACHRTSYGGGFCFPSSLSHNSTRRRTCTRGCVNVTDVKMPTTALPSSFRKKTIETRY